MGLKVLAINLTFNQGNQWRYEEIYIWNITCIDSLFNWL